MRQVTQPCNVFLRLPPNLNEKLEGFSERTGRPRNVVLRFLLAKATIDDLPRSWLNLSPEEKALLKLAG
jgi:hypothetical protein